MQSISPQTDKRKRHPFARSFSPRRMAVEGFDRRTPPQHPSPSRHCDLCGHALRPNGYCSNRRCESQPKAEGAKTVRELVELHPPVPLFHSRRWGSWRLDCHRLTLDFAPQGVWRYKLDLESLHDSASILDFVFQVHGKIWATPQVTADLLDALHDIFDLQASLCSCGRNKRIARGFVASQVEPPTEAEGEESARSTFDANAAWLGSEATMGLLNRKGCTKGEAPR